MSIVIFEETRMRTNYDPAMTMAAARDRYFEVNGFGADGGYGSAWVDFKLGPLPFPFPNTAGRVRALRYHDLHHVLTDYDTDTRGEFEISAWELGAGCRDFAAAWVLNLGGLVGGLVSAPIRTFRAFVRGRRARSLYGRSLDELLGSTVAETRRSLAIEPDPRPRLGDVFAFAAAVASGLVVGLGLFTILLALLPLGLVMNALRRRARAA